MADRVVWSGALEARGLAAGLSSYRGPSQLAAAIEQIPEGGDPAERLTLRESRKIKAPGSEGGWRSGRLRVIEVED